MTVEIFFTDNTEISHDNVAQVGASPAFLKLTFNDTSALCYPMHNIDCWAQSDDGPEPSLDPHQQPN